MRLEEIQIEQAQKLIDFAELEGTYIKHKNDIALSLSEIIERFQDYPNFAIYNLMKGRKRIGLIATYQNDEANTINIGFSYVREKYKEKGFEKVMIGLFINKARSLGYKRITVSTWGSNQLYQEIFKSLSFYKLQEEFETRENKDSTITYDLKL
jgi:RimJ/RimL family protein N-acetyltransferase